ncbi:3',5'-cyclic AMP phosphodiesterase CpdA [Granulicella pectinivorans]|uniref:3',5'-cyclic AMP phosphodiesterase CpdA n=1 Tax=Granulicella pectinivorans TaxID=474950 RepID=A0A1I6LYX5_9BACT|nr:metallophosphoesterase [Granulicella pectinivorans]SFS08640.1 3',5'-cyclic AMP phosphodiesterase CpdA [Granulicella pectinivorans]
MISSISRRRFAALATAAALAPRALALPPKPEPFTFLFFTDAHLQPELNGVLGTDMAFRHARTMGARADFAINGGDHVFDANKVTLARASQLFDLYGKTEQDLGLKVHHTLGNHDIFAIGTDPNTSIASPADSTLFGKRLFEDRFGKTYYSFDHKGHHFIVLDSIQIMPTGIYQGRIDPDQLKWLAADLAAQPHGTPIIVVTHYPIVSAIIQYEAWRPSPDPKLWVALINSEQVWPLFAGYNVIGVLQGHTHVNERVDWHGIPYLTSGAICGNWWKGTRLGTPEGFTVVRVEDGKLTTHYETYGFQSSDPHNT